MQEGLAIPRFSIEFTNHCNFKCVMCPQSVWGKSKGFDRNKGYMPEKVFESALKIVKHAGAVSIGFFGEQMLHPKFVEYITRLSKGNYKLILFSNFSLLTAEIISSIMLCDVVKISLDSSNAELFEKLCPGGDYGRIEENIHHWLSLKGRPKTYLLFTTSSINRHDKDMFLKKWLPKLNRNDEVITKSVITYGGVMNDEYMSKNKCRVLKKKRLIIAWNGDISLCNLDVNMSMKVGNTLEGIDFIKYKYQLDNIKSKHGICGNCFDANNHRHTRFYHGEKNVA